MMIMMNNDDNYDIIVQNSVRVKHDQDRKMLKLTLIGSGCNTCESVWNELNVENQLNSTQLYYDTFAAEQLNSWIAKYSSIT